MPYLPSLMPSKELGVDRTTVTKWFTSNTSDCNASKPRDHRIKLDREEVDQIMDKLDRGSSQTKVAADHKISQQRVSQIKDISPWRSLNLPRPSRTRSHR